MSNIETQNALSLLDTINREVWFKIDQMNKDGVKKINQVNLSTLSVKRNLEAAISNSPTFIQTCLFSFKHSFIN